MMTRHEIRRDIGITLAIMGVLVAGSWAQQAVVAPKSATVPTISEVDALKLDRALLVDENLRLRIAQLQDQFVKHQDELRALIASMQKPGFTFGRTDAGVWQYTVKPPESAPPPVPVAPPIKPPIPVKPPG